MTPIRRLARDARGWVPRESRVLLAALVLLAEAGCGRPALRHPETAAPILPCVEDDCLRVLTWNVHAIPFLAPRPGARLANVAAKIREQQPDLVLLQEVWSYAYARQLTRDLGGAYRIAAASGCGRPFPCGGLVVFVRIASGWAASAPTFVTYDDSAPWYRIAEWDGLAKKGMLLTEVTRGDAVIAVADTHLQSEYARYGRDYSDIRRRQLQQLAATLARRFGDRPVVVGGDLNTSPGERSRLYESHVVALGEDRTTDLRIACGRCGTRPGMQRPARWLDYVLTRNLPATAAAERIVNRGIDDPFSDHDAVLVRLETGG